MVSLVLVLAMGAFYLPWKFLHPYFHLGQQLLCGHFTAPCNYYTPISLALALAISTFHFTLQFTALQFHLHLHLPSAHFTYLRNSCIPIFTWDSTCHLHISLHLAIYCSPISLALALAICTFHLPSKFLHSYFHLGQHLPSAHFTAPCNLLLSNFTCTCTCHLHISLTLEIPAFLFSLGTALAICTFHCTLQFTAPQFHLHLHLPSAHFTYLGNSCMPIFTWDSTCHLHISLHLAIHCTPISLALALALAICTFHFTLQFTALQFHLHLHLPSAPFTA